MSGALLLLAVSILGASIGLPWLPDRTVLGPRSATVRFEPVRLESAAFAPLRLAGAWQVLVDDPRFGGVSALAIDGGKLLALTDSGVVVRLPKPGSTVDVATLNELPAGPGSPRYKRRHDSEALARDPHGRGWWVAFEQRHELWLYDLGFRRPLERIRFGTGRWSSNSGIEALAVRDGKLLLIPEPGRTMFRLSDGRLEQVRFQGRGGRIADAAALPDGTILLVERKLTLRGFVNSLIVLERSGGAYRKGRRWPLGVGPLDNVEALAVEKRAGGVRLWLMTDDNDTRPLRSLLIAVDLIRG